VVQEVLRALVLLRRPILSAAGSTARYSGEVRRSSILCSISLSRAAACASRRALSGPSCFLARSLTSTSRARCRSSWAISSSVFPLALVMTR
jgi:hypothetical protein